jgi:iron complex transport system permease protein
MPSTAHDADVLRPVTATPAPPTRTRTSRQALAWLCALGLLLALALASLLVGAGDMHWSVLWSRSEDDLASQVLVYSRVPRTVALLLAGASMAVCGLLMQMLARNHFLEPSTVGTVESASLGMLASFLWVPHWPVIAKMGLSAVAALLGTALFLAVLSRIRLRSSWMVPLVGLVLAGVLEAAGSFVALQFDMMQALKSWSNGDFSLVVQGRYELLWLSLGATALACLAADRFTVAGLGESFATNLGLNYRRLVWQGLVVPNVVRLFLGDNVRRSVLWVALIGAGLTLLCDLAGRLLIAPYEIPVGTVLGVLGSALFLVLILRRRKDRA